MYQALYRKWRPKTFDEVVGQEHITETLKKQVMTGHLSHAYIFIGTRGTGKTTCARILAKSINCEHPVNGNPCNCCPSCLGIENGRILDVVELDAASNNGVDNVRALREEALFSPSEVKKRVYIIDEVHMLSTAAFNALLKIMEEPPEHLLFILATTELHKVPATVLSRCQRHSFRRIGADKIADYLQVISDREKFTYQKDALDLIARLADGGVRDALSILDQCAVKDTISVEAVYETIGLSGNLEIIRLLDAITAHDTPAVMELFQHIWMNGVEPGSLLDELYGLLRDVLIVNTCPTVASQLVSEQYPRSALERFAKQLTKDEILFAEETLQRTLEHIRLVRNPKTTAELCLISLSNSLSAESVSGLRARIAKLEKDFASFESHERAYAPESRTPQDPDLESMEEPVFSDSIPLPDEVPDQETALVSDRKKDKEEAEDLNQSAESDIRNVVPDEVVIGEIREGVKQLLPMELKSFVQDPTKFRMYLSESTLHLDVIPGFFYDRFRKTEILAAFEAAAEKTTGRKIRAQLEELKISNGPMRDINELKQFKEVKFI